MGFYDILWDCYQPNGMIHDDFWGFIQKYVSSTFMMISEDSSTCRTSSLRRLPPVVQPPPRLLQAAWAKATATPPRARSVAEADALLRHFAFDPVRHRRYASMHPGALNPFAKEWAPPQTPGSCAIGLGEISWDGVDPGGVWGNFRVYVARPRFLKNSWKSTIFNEKIFKTR